LSFTSLPQDLLVVDALPLGQELEELFGGALERGLVEPGQHLAPVPAEELGVHHALANRGKVVRIGVLCQIDDEYLNVLAMLADRALREALPAEILEELVGRCLGLRLERRSMLLLGLHGCQVIVDALELHVASAYLGHHPDPPSSLGHTQPEEVKMPS
jgi:hypothetical protein